MTASRHFGSDNAGNPHFQDGNYYSEAPASAQPAQSTFSRWIHHLGIRRSAHGWLGGVCAGVTERLRWDPLPIRMLWLILGILSWVGIVLYIAAWFLLPDAHDVSLRTERKEK